MTGGTGGLVAQLGDGLVLGADLQFTGASIPAGYPGDGGAEGNLLAIMILSPQYSGSADEIAVTISDFVVSGINPFDGSSVTLNACDADLDPFNGCYDVDTFETPSINCAGIVSTYEGVYGSFFSACVGTRLFGAATDCCCYIIAFSTSHFRWAN